jgi:hypothetical protein
MLSNLLNRRRWADYSFAMNDLVNNNCNIVSTLLMSDRAHFHMSGYVNEQNFHYWSPNNPHELHPVLCIVQKWQCGMQFLLMALLIPVSLRMQRGVHCECRVVQSHAGNISAKSVMSSTAWFAIVPTRWSNRSHSTNFCASPQDSVSRHTHFSSRGHHLASTVTWSCSTRLLPLGLCQRQGMRRHVLPILMPLKSEFGSVFKGSLRKCCNEL